MNEELDRCTASRGMSVVYTTESTASFDYDRLCIVNDRQWDQARRHPLTQMLEPDLRPFVAHKAPPQTRYRTGAWPLSKRSDEMQIEKARLKQSVESLTKRAEECFEAAHAQHLLAERQQANADKLSTIGQTLETDAARLNGEVEMVSLRSSAPIMGPEESAGRLSPTPSK